ncbi:MAG: M48 family metallopeptidase, partial [Chloroflexi bacterium]|nr:M48 family metallopeptidase [Chloroflexota bacterium]
MATEGPTLRRRQISAGPVVIEYSLRRSQRRRRTIEIAVDATKGVSVAAPARATNAAIDELVRRRAPWILKRLAALEAVATTAAGRQWTTGETVLYLGQEYALRVDAISPVATPEVSLNGRCLKVRLPAGEGEESALSPEGEGVSRQEDRRTAVAEMVEAWYRWEATRLLGERVAAYAPLLGVKPGRVVVRHQERRWGSCAPDGTLRFNWRLILAPPPILDYVVVHELCHLLHLNHGPQFW